MKAPAVTVRPSIDRRHLLRTGQFMDPARANQHSWSLFESATGTRITVFEFHGALPRCVMYGHRLMALPDGSSADPGLTG